MTAAPLKITLSSFAILAVAGSLSACGSAAPEKDAAADASTATGSYTDGTYEAQGSYQTPNGTERLDISVTLKDSVIVDVEVVGHGDNPDSQRYQSQFVGGIDDVAVGKNIDEIQVNRVAGSSLTSGGFNRAVEEIKKEAAA